MLASIIAKCAHMSFLGQPVQVEHQQ